MQRSAHRSTFGTGVCIGTALKQPRCDLDMPEVDSSSQEDVISPKQGLPLLYIRIEHRTEKELL